MNDPLSRHTLEAKYRRSKILNGVLAAIVVFLGIVVVAQMLPGQSPTSSPTPAASETTGGEQATGGDMDFVRREAGDPKAIGEPAAIMPAQA